MEKGREAGEKGARTPRITQILAKIQAFCQDLASKIAQLDFLY